MTVMPIGLTFHCSPLEFLDLSDHFVDKLYERTALMVRRMNS
jgi:hypothetical protein